MHVHLLFYAKLMTPTTNVPTSSRLRVHYTRWLMNKWHRSHRSEMEKAKCIKLRILEFVLVAADVELVLFCLSTVFHSLLPRSLCCFQLVKYVVRLCALCICAIFLKLSVSSVDECDGDGEKCIFCLECEKSHHSNGSKKPLHCRRFLSFHVRFDFFTFFCD